MPQFVSPRPVAGITANRSWPQFLWKSGALVAFCGMLCVVSIWKMPQLTPLLLVPLVVCSGLVAASVEGWFTEGVARNSNGTMAVCYTRLIQPPPAVHIQPQCVAGLDSDPLSRKRWAAAP